MSSATRVLIRGGTVVDGSGRAPCSADVLVEGERIAEIGPIAATVTDVDTTIDATGLVVCPGFIDPHNHADSEVEGGILKHPLADNLVRQGITTLVCNQCGGATYPVAPFLDGVDAARPVSNVAMLASHSHTRRQAMQRAGVTTPCPETWAIMRDLIRDEMEAGAFGVTSCPLGASQERLPTAELIEAARGVGPYCGVYASHIRDEGETGRHLDAIDEVRTVARESGARGHVSHLKLWGHFNWGKTEPVLAIFDRARAEGTALAADQYPYIGGYRGFFSLLWDHQTPEIADPARRRAAEAEVRRQLDLLGGPDRLIVSSHEKDDPLDGKTIGEAGAMLGLAPEAVVPELYLRKPQPRLSAFFLAMHEDDVRVFMASEHTMAGTDSHVRMPGSGASHPRNFGVYPRLLGRYVRDAKIVSLERMVQRMTARVADQFGIKQRGRLERGYFADLVVFNPRTVIDCSTWQDGYRYPEGIVWVLVNGGIEVADEKLVGKGYGRAIRRG